MIEPPYIIATEPQAVAALRLRITWAEMRTLMRPALTEVRDVIAAQGLVATGPWFNRHARTPTDTLDFAICVPVASAITPARRVAPDLLPAMTVARTIMHGDYADLSAAWSAFREWIAANGHQTQPEFWECYTVGPETTADPTAWRTTLTWPLNPV